MNQSITYISDVLPQKYVNQDAIRPTSVLFAGLVQIPTYNVPIAVPEDVQETALIIISEFDTVRADVFRLIGD